MESVSLQLAKFLKEAGVTQVFTLTGGGAMFLNKAFHDVYRDDVCYMHHEQSCSMAAEAHARITGTPAVVNVTTGPGAINAMNGVFGAFTDSIPMIVVSGQVKRETSIVTYDDQNLRQLGDQEANVIKMVAPICKYAVFIKSEEELEVELPRALGLASSGRPGPVWLDIPADIQMSSQKLVFQPHKSKSTPMLSPFTNDLVQLVGSLIKSSRRPLILAGTGVRLSGTVDELSSFSQNTGIPIATAWTHDLIESSSAYFAGRTGTIGTRPGNFCLQNADLVFVLGSRLNIRQTSFNWQSFAKGAVIVHVDIDKAELDKFYLHSNHKINLDLRHFFNAMTMLKIHDNYHAWRKWCSDIGKKYDVKNESFLQSAEGTVNPYKAVIKISNALLGSEVIVCGNASACIIPFQCIEIRKGQRLFSNSGAASMGYDLPAAIGACIAMKTDPTSNVICFAGDGSIQMNIQELQTVVSKKLNIKIIIINNGGYLSIRSTHKNFFGEVFGADPESGIDFPDFCKISEAYGLHSYRIRSDQELASIADILTLDGPVVIELMADRNQEFCPKLKSRIDTDGNFITPELDDMFPFLPLEVLNSIRLSAQEIS